MRWLALAFALSVVSLANASFELLLVADNGANTFATRKIHRFDPQSGVYLGSFGGFNTRIVGTHLSQSTNSLYVATDDNRIAAYDYNTGVLKSSFTGFNVFNRNFSINPSVTRTAVFDGLSDVYIGDFPSTVFIGGGPVVFGATFSAGLWDTESRLVAYSSSGRFVTFDLSAFTVESDFTVANGLTAGQMACNGGTAGYVMATTDGVFSSDFGSVVTAGTIKGIASAHDGFFAGVTSPFTSPAIVNYDRTYGFRGEFGFGIVSENMVSMQTVLAPEPTSLAALALGGLALLRRRKN